jgi:hypothetical protein
VDDFLPQTTRTAETEHGHEENRLSVRGLVIFASAMAALTTLVLLVLTTVMGGFAQEFKREQALTPPMFKEDAGTFPAPRLQSDPTGEFATFKQQQLDQLNGYGWVDQKQEIAHIPIDRAIEILAEKGLPKGTRPAMTPAEAAGPAAGREARPAPAGDKKP